MTSSPARMMRYALRAMAIALPALFSGLGPTWGQAAYPSQPIRFVIAFGPGGVGDTTSRLVAEKLGEKLGQRVVIENNPGGGGIAAARTVLSAPADGHTLALLTNGTSISVSLFKNLTFNPLTDFAPVTRIGKFEFFFAANAASPYGSLADVLKTARDNPGKLSARSLLAAPSTSLRCF
jgi:tripartite-type tricarboxylate transporter receptor subunit TctC